MTSGVVLGAGLVGSYLGALAGLDRVIPSRPGRGPRALQALDPRGRIHTWQPAAVSDISSEAPLLVCCRVPQTPTDLPGNALSVQNGLGQNTSRTNGLDSHGSLDSQLVTAFLAVDLDAQGRVHATGPTPRLVLRDPGPRYHGLLSTWRSAGIQVDVVEPQQALAARWEKVILNATVGPLCLARGWSMAAVWATPETRALVEAASAEGCAVADACGIHLQHGVLDRAAVFFAATGAHRPSTVQGPSELPWILGYLLHRAQEHGVDTPALTAIAEPLRQSGIDVDWHEQGALSLG